jgi:hypothetical protein
VGRNEIPAVHGVVVVGSSEVVAGRRNNGEVVVDASSLRAHNQWILIGEFIETTSLGCLLCWILFLIRSHETDPKKKAQRKDVAFSFLPFSFSAGTDTVWINP